MQRFDKDELKPLTLIRERMRGTDAAERAPLLVSDLLGTWQGKAITQYADLRPDTYSTSQLTIEQSSSTQIRQTLQLTEDIPPNSSVGHIEGSRILFESEHQSVQVLLLPAGTSSTCPVKISPRQPLFLEVGWLLDSHTRQRLMRWYDAAGAWTHLTLTTERKV